MKLEQRSDEEYQTLVLIADCAWHLFARYPFDSDEEMAPRWRALGLWLAEWAKFRPEKS